MPHCAESFSEQEKLLKKSKRRLLRVVFGRTMVILLALVLQFFLLFVFMFGLFQNVPLLFGGTMAFTAIMLLYLLNTRDHPSIKLTWCFIIAVLPLFGALLYFFVRYDFGHRVMHSLIDRSIRAGSYYLPDRTLQMDHLKQEDPKLYHLAHYLRQHGGNILYGSTEVRYFPLGEEKFAEMLIQLEQAEKFIFLEYFSIAPSYMWDSILEILIRKAAQGVEVRVMYDGSCAVSYLPYHYPKQLQKLGIQCKMFSPFRPAVSTHYNNRDHRKILVIDGHTAFTGGVNLLDRYINRKQVYGHWKDTAIMVKGEAAQGFTNMFLQMWNATEKEQVYQPYLATTPVIGSEGYVIPYCDSPLDDERVGEMVYLNMLNQAQDYVYIMTPYLILDNEMETALCFAAKRGVDVRLILPHIPDKKYAFALAKGHYPALLQAGVKIYEYTPGFIHAKVFLCDDREAVVGTINLDYRSLYLHFECAAYLYRVPALQDIKQDFAQTMSVSQQISHRDIRKRTLLSRLTGALLKVIAPLM